MVQVAAKYVRMSTCKWINYLGNKVIELLDKDIIHDQRIDNLEERVIALETAKDLTNQTYSGIGVPAMALGTDNDTYLQLDNGSVWKKIAGDWHFNGFISLCGEAFSEKNS